jgi:hypothetical protein
MAFLNSQVFVLVIGIENLDLKSSEYTQTLNSETEDHGSTPRQEQHF